MSTERWRQIEALFKAAITQEPEDIEAYLIENCEDEALRKEVYALLKADHQADQYLSSVFSRGLEQFHGEESDPRIGTRIGPYKVIRLLGRGGVSSVYLVQRDDRQYRKFLALKLVRRGMDTADILNRFRHERQILASLDHPNIARFYDGGTTEDGVPFFVMEKIDGMPITAYCDEKQLPLRKRLELFCEVCSAVELAHRNLVVHRDLKPSNILVTQEGVPKLLDFGIAKLLNPELVGGGTLAPTAQATKLMTPGYASPEQIKGGQISTASDIYSLGVLLYEMLTGRRPYRESRDFSTLERQILEEIPRAPSQVTWQKQDPDDQRTWEPIAQARGTTPEQLRKLLSGDLDNITMLALRKEPSRRYPSVAQFREDIQRHMQGHPVKARKDTLGYRTGKFIGRNRLGVGMALLATLTTLTLLVVLFVQSGQLRQERDLVVRERDRAQKALALVDDLFKMTDPEKTRGDHITAMELLDRGAERTLELDDDRDTSFLLETLASLYEDLALYDRSFPLRKRNARILKKIHGEVSYQAAQGLSNVGYVLAMKGDYAGAETYFRACLEMRKKVYRPDHPMISFSISNLALVLHDLGDYGQALAYYQEGLAIDEKLEDETEQAESELKANLALLYNDLGDYPKAESMYREVLDLRTRVLGSEDIHVVNVLYSLGGTLFAAGKYEQAETLLRQALRLQRQRYGSANADVAHTETALGHLLSRVGKLDEARELLFSAKLWREKNLGPKHLKYAGTLLAFAEYYRVQNQGEVAKVHLIQALDIYKHSKLYSHPESVETILRLARIYEEEGAYEPAIELLTQALQIRRRSLPEGNWLIAEVENALGGCLWMLAPSEEARELLEKSVPPHTTHLGKDHPKSQLANKRLRQSFKSQRASE